MLKRIFYALICVPLGLFAAKPVVAAGESATAGESAYIEPSAYDFVFTSITGEALPLAQFRGKPLLVVNTASECGFTPQYADLQKLYDLYGERGLVVIAVPSDDFGGQEPLTGEALQEFCQVHYGVQFLVTERTSVKGAQAHPFYRWAREQKGALAAPKWNFHKYLVAPDGSLHDWYASTTSPLAENITRTVESSLPAADIAAIPTAE